MKILLFSIIIIGSIFRFLQISPFKFYPDAYQSLIVAENIETYHNVLGYLGSQGMTYPIFFMWTRPGYPLLIDLFNIFTNDPTLSAQTISFVAGSGGILLAFFCIKNFFNSSTYGLAGALLLALSFNHTLWSGFIMTETLGIFLLLLFLWSFFSNLSKKAALANKHDFLTGILFAGAIMTRYEYVILLFPIIFLTVQKSNNPFIQLANILFSSVTMVTILLMLLFPLNSLWEIILLQLNALLQKGILLFFIFLICIIALFTIPSRYKHFFSNGFTTLTKLFLCVLLLIFFLEGIFAIQILFITKHIPALVNFFHHELLISFFSLFGLLLFIKDKKV